MKKRRLLINLAKERKLKLIKPSEEVKNSYLKKSESFLLSAKILVKNKKLEEAVSLAYYSMYYSLMALLLKVGIKSENHTASIILLKELFGIDNREIKVAKKERIDKQYYVDFKITGVEVRKLIRMAENFNSILFDFIEKLKNEEVEKIRKRFKRLISEKL